MNWNYSNSSLVNIATPKSSSQKQEIARLSLSKPLIIGYMSVNGERQYRSDLSQLKFLNTIPRGRISLDLNDNIDMAIKRTTDDNDEKITLLLRFLIDQHAHLKRIFKPSFISYRRTFISIMCNAYENTASLKIAATLYKGSLYLCSLETQEETTKRQSRSTQEDKFCAWGYKFEQYLLSEFLRKPPDIHKPVIENEEFTIYYTAILGRKQLLYGAQIDGLLATHQMVTNPPNTTNVGINLEYLRQNSFVELKTNKIIQHYRQNRNFKRYKLLRCWCQCYLADLKGLLMGYRTDDGIIQYLQWFYTQDIVSYCKDVWNPQTAIDYLDYILTYIESSFQNHNNHDLTTLQFELCSNRKIVVSILDKNVILPNWFIEKYEMDA